VNIPGEGEPTAKPYARRNIDSSAYLTHAGSTIRSRVSRREESHLPAALRTGRDSLLSSGPHSPAGGECDEVPVGEEGGLVAVDHLQPLGRSGVLAAESFELVHGPPG